MKTIEKFVIGAGIVLVLYMVMKDDGSKDDKPTYEYQRRMKGVRGADFEEWEKKKGSSGSRS